MKNRRGSLWGTGAEEMVLQFKPGDVVKPVIVNNLGFSGVVRDVDARINKVWVSWGNGPVTQHDPDEVQLLSPQDATVRDRMASGRRVKKADAGFFADKAAGEETLGARRGKMAAEEFGEAEGPRVATRRGRV